MSLSSDRFRRLVDLFDSGLVSRRTLLEETGLAIRGDSYGDYPEEEAETEKKKMSLSKRPFEPGTLVKARRRKPFHGSGEVVLYECVRWNAREIRVSGTGFWTVIDSHPVAGGGYWHRIVRGDGVLGWVQDLESDFVVVQNEDPGA